MFYIASGYSMLLIPDNGTIGEYTYPRYYAMGLNLEAYGWEASFLPKSHGYAYLYAKHLERQLGSFL